MSWNPDDWIALALPYATAGLGALASLIGFVIAGWIVYRLIIRAASHDPERQDILQLLASAARFSVICFGVVVALDTLGVQVSALIAGLGLTGFALGFALKDILQSMLAGVMIMLNRPFRSGDYIEVAGFHGTVIEIALRYTRLRDGPKDHLIPNNTVLTSPVTVGPEPPPEAAAQPTPAP
jgi:small-conductance mechanosensitive channel